MVYFVPKKHARLGNWLFQYAVAASMGDGEVATIDNDFSRKAIASYQDFLYDLKLVDNFPSNSLVFKEDRRKFVVPPLLREDQTLVLDGYFQQVQYLDRNKFIKKFALNSKKRNAYLERFGEWLARPGITSIHVRRGDYLKLAHCHPFVGETYFRNCLSSLADANDFMIFSDDMEWCKRFFPKAFPDKRFAFIAGTNMLDDIHLQSMCENNIISNSSFSWWAAYLNDHSNKRILAPDNWFGFYLRAQGIDGKGMYYPGMERVPVRYPPSLKIKAVFDMIREVPLNMAAAIYHVLAPR